VTLVDDPYCTFVPPGDYIVGLIHGEEKYEYRGRTCCRCTWQILDDGEHHGLLVYSWYNYPAKDELLKPGHDLWQAYVVATGLRPPAHLVNYLPRWFLADCQFRAAVRTVGKDSYGIDRPETASYSRVDHLKERIEGTPPCLLKRGSS